MAIDLSFWNTINSAKPLNVLGTLGEVAKFRTEQDDSRQRREMGKLQIAEQRMKLEEFQRAQEETDRLRTLFNRTPDQPPVTPADILSVVGPERGHKVLTGIAALHDQEMKTFTTTQQTVGALVGGILALPEPMRPEAYTQVRQKLIARGMYTADQIPEQYSPEYVAQVQQAALTAEQQVTAAATAKRDADKRAEPINVSQGNTLFDPVTKKAIYTAPASESPMYREWQDYKKEGGTLGFDAYMEKDANRKRSVFSMGGPGGAANGFVMTEKPANKIGNTLIPGIGLTYNGLYQGAVRFALTGSLPAMGMGSNPAVTAKRDAYQNTAGALAEAAGTDLATLQAEYKANAGALAKIVPLYNGTAAAVDTATHNIELARQESVNLARTGSKLVNRYAQWAQGNLTPAEGLSKFETYIYTAAREYAKVTSGAAMSVAGLTDSAAKEVEKIMNAAQSPQAFEAVTGAMQQDMANVTGAQERQIANISGVISSFLKVASGPKTGTLPEPQAPRSPLTPPTPAEIAARRAALSGTVNLIVPGVNGGPPRTLPFAADKVEEALRRGAKRAGPAPSALPPPVASGPPAPVAPPVGPLAPTPTSAPNPMQLQTQIQALTARIKATAPAAQGPLKAELARLVAQYRSLQK